MRHREVSVYFRGLSTSMILPQALLTNPFSRAGCFFGCNDMDDMANALMKVCNVATLQGALYTRGFNRAAEFSWQKMGAETMQLYKESARG
jgi:glycosyltransferase involved in cell wall biosynthesis